MNELTGDLLLEQREALDSLVRIYEVVYLDPKFHLRNRERDFFVLTVIGYLNGDRQHHTPEGRKKYEGEFTQQQVADYMRRLKAKKWVEIKRHPYKRISIPNFFKTLDLRSPVNINLTVACD